MRRLRLLLVLVLGTLVAAACQVDSTVRIRVAEDGSGTVAVVVRLDRDAAQRLGDPATAVRLDDLRAAGWTVDDPATDADSGELTFRAERPFAAPEDLPRVLAEVGGTGDAAIFRDVELQLGNGFATTTYDFSSAVALSGSLEQFSDADLSAALGGLPLGRTPEELAAEGAAGEGAAQLTVEVQLPGTVSDSNGEVHDARSGQLASWDFPLADGTPTDTTLHSGSSVTQRGPTVLVVAGLAFVGLAVVAAVVGLVRRRG